MLLSSQIPQLMLSDLQYHFICLFTIGCEEMVNESPYDTARMCDILLFEYNVGRFLKFGHDDVLERCCYVGFQFKGVDG